MICSSPIKTNCNYAEYEFECYDETYILDQSKISDRMYIASGSSYMTAIQQIITASGLSNIIFDSNGYTTHADREWPIGSQKMEIINTLLSECNYEEVYTDGDGFIHLSKKNNSCIPKWIYRQNKDSILGMEMTKTSDIYSIPNVFVGVVTNPDVDTITAKKVNDNVQSELSTINRGYELCEVYEFDDISTSTELNAYLNDEYLKSMMAIESVSFTTSIDGSHGHRDQIQIETDRISGLYTEISWDMSFTDCTITHTAERKISE